MGDSIKNVFDGAGTSTVRTVLLSTVFLAGALLSRDCATVLYGTVPVLVQYSMEIDGQLSALPPMSDRSRARAVVDRLCFHLLIDIFSSLHVLEKSAVDCTVL